MNEETGSLITKILSLKYLRSKKIMKCKSRHNRELRKHCDDKYAQGTFNNENMENSNMIEHNERVKELCLQYICHKNMILVKFKKKITHQKISSLKDAILRSKEM